VVKIQKVFRGRLVRGTFKRMTRETLQEEEERLVVAAKKNTLSTNRQRKTPPDQRGLKSGALRLPLRGKQSACSDILQNSVAPGEPSLQSSDFIKQTCKKPTTPRLRLLFPHDPAGPCSVIAPLGGGSQPCANPWAGVGSWLPSPALVFSGRPNTVPHCSARSLRKDSPGLTKKGPPGTASIASAKSTETALEFEPPKADATIAPEASSAPEASAPEASAPAKETSGVALEQSLPVKRVSRSGTGAEEFPTQVPEAMEPSLDDAAPGDEAVPGCPNPSKEFNNAVCGASGRFTTTDELKRMHEPRIQYRNKSFHGARRRNYKQIGAPPADLQEVVVVPPKAVLPQVRIRSTPPRYQY
jgi:hypothetical protein